MDSIFALVTNPNCKSKWFPYALWGIVLISSIFDVDIWVVPFLFLVLLVIPTIPPVKTFVRKKIDLCIFQMELDRHLWMKFIDDIPLATFEFDRELTITKFNNHFENLLELDDNVSYKGVHWDKLLNDFFFRLTESALNKEDTTKEAITGDEYKINTNRGHRLHVLAYTTPKFLNDELVGWRGCLVDNTKLNKTNEELSKKVAWFEKILDHIPTSICIKSQSHNFELVNKSFLEFNKLEEKQIIGKSDLEINKNRDQVLEEWTSDIEVLQLLDSLCYTEVLTDEYCNRRFIDIKKIPISFINNNSRYVLKIANEISEELKMKNRHRALLESIPFGYVLLEPNKTLDLSSVKLFIKELNNQFLSITGHTSAEIVGKSMDAIWPMLKLVWKEIFFDIAKSGDSEYYDNFTFNHKKYFRICCYSPNNDQCAVLFQEVQQGSTFQVIPKLNPVQSVTRTSDTFASLVWNQENSCLFWSDSIYEIFNIEKEEEISLTKISDRVYYKDILSFENYLNEIQLGKSNPYHFFRISSDGQVKLLRLNINKSYKEDGSFDFYEGIFRDVSRAKN